MTDAPPLRSSGTARWRNSCGTLRAAKWTKCPASAPTPPSASAGWPITWTPLYACPVRVCVPCATVCLDALLRRKRLNACFALFLQAKKRVLIPAFTRALKDPFPYARLAGLQALQGKHAMHREEAGAQTEGRPGGRARMLTRPRPNFNSRPVPSPLPVPSFPPRPSSRLRFPALVKQRPRTTTRRRTSPSE